MDVAVADNEVVATGTALALPRTASDAAITVLKSVDTMIGAV